MAAHASTDDAPAVRALAELVRSGQAEARYPEVRPLLADLDDADLARAGTLLGRLDVDEIQRLNPGRRIVPVAIMGHGNVSALAPALTAQFARHGLVLRPHTAGYNMYVTELGDPESSTYTAGPDLALCLLDAAAVFDDLQVPWGVSDVQRALDDKLRLLDGLVSTFESNSEGTLVLNTMPLLRQFSAQLIDHRSRAELGAVWREANARLLRLTREHPSLVVIDLDPLAVEDGALTDPRFSQYTKSHISPTVLGRYAREIGHLARQQSGQLKKALVLDLDGTVWGGVLGDDGPQGVEVGGSYRGEAYAAFQRIGAQLSAQGVLLAVASKNDPELVREAFRTHPDMVLRERHLTRVSANWAPKPDNLRDLARSLNLSLDSLVFADDSAFERGLVRRELPEVVVVPLDGDPALHAVTLLHDGWFDTRELSDEDRIRPQLYQQESARADFLSAFSSVAGYLRELRIQVTIASATESDAARLSQLTMRTNQFNMTVDRLQQSDVRRKMNDPDADILTIRAADRFGDNGLVGAIFLTRTPGNIVIDNFLLSCRVFSRGIEQAGIATVLSHARAEGAERVIGIYRPHGRNGMAAGLYPRLGFHLLEEEPPTRTFGHDLRDIVTVPDHIDLRATWTGDATDDR